MKNTISIKKVFSHYFKAFTLKDKCLYGIVLFFQILRQSSFVISPYIYKKIFDYMSTTNMHGQIAYKHILSIFTIIVVIRLIAFISGRITSFITAKLNPRIYNQAKNNAYKYLMNHSNTFFANNFVGALTQKVNKYADSLWNLSDSITIDFLSLFVKIFGMLTILFFVDKRLVLGMGIWVFVFLLISFLISRRRKPISIALSVEKTNTNAHLSDTVSNQTSISFFGAYNFEVASFEFVSGKLRDTYIKRNMLDFKINAFYSAFVTFFELAIIGFSLYLWSQDKITSGTVILLQSYLITLIDDIWGFSRIIQSLEESYADAREMVEILETPHEVQDKKDAKELIIDTGTITFNDVVFAYNQNNEVISNINLEIMSGQKVGLIGPSGAGKSTLVKLLLRFFDVTGGSVQIDNQDIREVTQNSLHNAIGFVPQDPSLFHRSLMDNIRYGRRDATDEEVYDAARKAHADEFIQKLPEGYNTLVGERGVKLSGGERQRIAIARAILKNAPILVLDEATSALDSESERLIQDALTILMEGKTVLVIAHRLSTIQHMDRILVINEGNIIEDATHDYLIKDINSLYKKLWDLQVGGFIK